MHQVKERAEKRESSSARCDHRMAGLEQGAAVRDERMDGLGTDTLGATAPATKWHLRMNRKGGPPMYLNVELDPMNHHP